MLKNLNSFIYFDYKAFLKGKQLQFLECDDWFEYNKDKEAEAKLLGSKCTINIYKDNTEYPVKSDGSKAKKNLRLNFIVKSELTVDEVDKYFDEGDNVALMVHKCVPYKSQNSKFGYDELSVEADLINLNNIELNAKIYGDKYEYEDYIRLFESVGLGMPKDESLSALKMALNNQK